MDTKAGGSADPVERWPDHLAEVGSASLMPEVALPRLELGFAYWHGKLK